MKRDFTKDWMDDTEYFRHQRVVGQSFQERVVARLRGHGVGPIVSYDDGFRASVAEIPQYTRESGDLLIRGHHFEVKSRAVHFTSPDDWPRSYWPMFLDTVDGLNAKTIEPVGYIFISQSTYAIMGVLVESSAYWTIERKRDWKRGIDENFYCVPRDCVMDEREITRFLRALPREDVMQIINAKWTPQVNMLVIECSCGHQFEHRSDRWRVFCPRCRAQDGRGPLRQRCALMCPSGKRSIITEPVR